MAAVEFIHRSKARPERVGILAGSFNPPTLAHSQLIYAAGFQVDEVLCVLPRLFPHKEYFGATLEQRLAMMLEAEPAAPYSIAVSEQGRFIDIAREARAHYGAETQLLFVCGADAAERIVNWDYGQPGAIAEMLGEFELLVAPREGMYEPPPELRHRIHPLRVRVACDGISSTAVRERIRRGEPWEYLVPRGIVDKVRAIYS